jgi:hypothetical protein
MRKLAEFMSKEQPDIIAVCEIGSGDSRTLATRFAMQWAYRGRQALLWNEVFSPVAVHDLYLPARRPIDRRGFVRVDGTLLDRSCTLATTQFAASRNPRIPQIRFARTQLRKAENDAVFFALVTDRGIGFEDLGYRELASTQESERVYLRGFDAIEMRVAIATV